MSTPLPFAPFAIPAASLTSALPLMPAAPSATLPTSIAVTHRFLGLSQFDACLAVISFLILLILYIITLLNNRAGIGEAGISDMSARRWPASVRMMMGAPQVGPIEATDFLHCGEKDEEKGIENGCSICLTEFKKGNRCRCLTKCGHVFHRNCVDRWLRVDRSCPLCRTCVCIVVHGSNPKITSSV